MGQLVSGLGQLLETGSGLAGGLTEPCSPSHPHAVLVPVQPGASLVLEPICHCGFFSPFAEAEELYQKRVLTITGICVALLVVGIVCVVAYCKTK